MPPPRRTGASEGNSVTTHYANLAKSIALCHSLEAAHRRAAPSVDDRLQLSRSNYSRKMREAIIFSCCGSWEADRIAIPVAAEEAARDANASSKTRSAAYVDRFIDGWTPGGVPELWYSPHWKKHAPLPQPARAMHDMSPQRRPASRAQSRPPSAAGGRSASAMSRPASRGAQLPAGGPRRRSATPAKGTTPAKHAASPTKRPNV